jgi:hypothetical protein
MKYSNDFGVGMMLKGGGHVAPVFFLIFIYFRFVIRKRRRIMKKERKFR